MDKDIRERIERNIEKRNRSNAEIMEANGFSEEQIETIEWLCERRHEIHSNVERYFNSSSGFDIIEDSEDIINALESCNLPGISFTGLSEMPTDMDYYDFMDSDERNEWENVASDNGYQSGYIAWKETSGMYDRFWDAMRGFNETIEDYLKMIDEQNGTNYAPTGIARYEWSLR